MTKEDKIKKLKENLEAYYETLEHLPIDSILGRMSILASIRKTEKKINRLQDKLGE